MEIYLDNSATTRAYPEVARLVTKLMLEDYGNPSALHQKGIDAEQYLRQARETMARILKAQEKEISILPPAAQSPTTGRWWALRWGCREKGSISSRHRLNIRRCRRL